MAVGYFSPKFPISGAWIHITPPLPSLRFFPNSYPMICIVAMLAPGQACPQTPYTLSGHNIHLKIEPHNFSPNFLESGADPGRGASSFSRKLGGGDRRPPLSPTTEDSHVYISFQNLLSLQRYPSIPLQMSSALDLVVIMWKVIMLVW